MEIVSQAQGPVLVAQVMTDRIDAAAAIQFKETMRKVIEAPGNPVILDLSRVHFLDSSGLGAVVAVMKLLAPQRRLELAGLTPTVDKVFRLTRMDKVFVIHAESPRIRAAG
ncbi:MAG: STAS domain-containing protein [Paracoccaceae bacterium]